jgi:hypothetical protein
MIQVRLNELMQGPLLALSKDSIKTTTLLVFKPLGSNSLGLFD